MSQMKLNTTFLLVLSIFAIAISQNLEAPVQDAINSDYGLLLTR